MSRESPPRRSLQRPRRSTVQDQRARTQSQNMQRKSLQRNEPALAKTNCEKATSEELYKKTFGEQFRLTKEEFDCYKLKMNENKITMCSYAQKPKYWILLAQPNPFDLKWIYSVPCGEMMQNGASCGNWMFLDVPLDCTERVWVQQRLRRLGWSRITTPQKGRFLCPCHTQRSLGPPWNT